MIAGILNVQRKSYLLLISINLPSLLETRGPNFLSAFHTHKVHESTKLSTASISIIAPMVMMKIHCYKVVAWWPKQLFLWHINIPIKGVWISPDNPSSQQSLFIYLFIYYQFLSKTGVTQETYACTGCFPTKYTQHTEYTQYTGYTTKPTNSYKTTRKYTQKIKIN